jgi:hypothetical protein
MVKLSKIGTAGGRTSIKRILDADYAKVALTLLSLFHDTALLFSNSHYASLGVPMHKPHGDFGLGRSLGDLSLRHTQPT